MKVQRAFRVLIADDTLPTMIGEERIDDWKRSISDSLKPVLSDAPGRPNCVEVELLNDSSSVQEALAAKGVDVGPCALHHPDDLTASLRAHQGKDAAAPAEAVQNRG